MNPGHLNKVMGRQMPFSERLAAGCIAGTWALTCDLALTIHRVQGATNWAANPVAHGWGRASDFLVLVPKLTSAYIWISMLKQHLAATKQLRITKLN